MIGWMRQGKHLDKDTEKVGYKEGETNANKRDET